jgi:hypothetical protein
MAEADLDVVIRQTAKQQSKSLIAAAKARRDRLMKLAAGAKAADARERYKLLARTTLEQGTAAAKRLQVAADNAADSYARALRTALAESLAKAALAKEALAKEAAAKAAAAKKLADKPPAKKAAKKAAEKTANKAVKQRRS